MQVSKYKITRMTGTSPFCHHPTSPSPYSHEERLQRALTHIDKHGFITLQEYTNLNRLSRSEASRELSKLVADPSSAIKTKGAGSHKVWVRGK